VLNLGLMRLCRASSLLWSTNLSRWEHRRHRHRGGMALLPAWTRNTVTKHFSVTMKSLSGVVNKITGYNYKCVDKSRGGPTGTGTGHHWSYTRRSPGLSPPLFTMIPFTWLRSAFSWMRTNFTKNWGSHGEFNSTPSRTPGSWAHIYAGDFIAYTAKELETHVTAHELQLKFPWIWTS